jgi:DNA-binding transcriptional LysR family regulator
MHIDFLGLQAFLSIADRGTFRSAAVHLNLSQTAISHRIRKLEDELGVKLLARTTRDISLTRAGIELLPKARKAVADLEQSLEELRQQGAKRRHRLDIACLPVFAIHYLPPILARFQKQNPGVEVRIFEAPTAAIAELVQAGDVEFGLSVIQAKRWDFDVETVLESSFSLACPVTHPFANRRSVSWSELETIALIRVGTKTAIRAIIDDAIGAERLAPNWQYEVQHVETAVNLVEMGLGLTIVPGVDVTLHRGGNLIAVPLRSPKVVCRYGLVTRRGTPLSAPAAAVRSLIVEEMNSKISRHVA